MTRCEDLPGMCALCGQSLPFLVAHLQTAHQPPTEIPVTS